MDRLAPDPGTDADHRGANAEDVTVALVLLGRPDEGAADHPT